MVSKSRRGLIAEGAVEAEAVIEGFDTVENGELGRGAGGEGAAGEGLGFEGGPGASPGRCRSSKRPGKLAVRADFPAVFAERH